MTTNTATVETREAAHPALGVLGQGDVPEWVMIAQTGTWRGHPSGPEVITVQHLRSALDYFRRHYHAFGAELPLDYHHGSVLAAQGRLCAAPAAGWIRDMELRGGGTQLWGRVLWTAEAAGAIAARHFRYLSPVLRFGTPDRVTGEPVPMIVHSVALTNTPFLTELQALNQQESSGAPGHSPATEPASTEQGGDPMPILEQIAAALGEPAQKVQSALGLESADDEYVAAELMARAVRLRELEDRLAEREAVIKALDLPQEADTAAVMNAVGALTRQRRSDEANKVVNEAVAAGRITPAQREFFLACARSDPEATRQCLNSLTPMITMASAFPRPGAQTARGLSESEQDVCRQLGLSAEAFLKAGA